MAGPFFNDIWPQLLSVMATFAGMVINVPGAQRFQFIESFDGIHRRICHVRTLFQRVSGPRNSDSKKFAAFYVSTAFSLLPPVERWIEDDLRS
jgi:hypothetical protein